MSTRAGRLYGNSSFWNVMNANYTKARIVGSVQKILDAGGDFEYGNYQKVLTPEDKWPTQDGYSQWEQWVGEAKESLAHRVNRQPVFPTDTTPPPETKLLLLQECLNYCFTHALRENNGRPGIPMYIEVHNNPDDTIAEHDIEIEWLYDKDGNPAQLNWTMLCPAGSKLQRAES